MLRLNTEPAISLIYYLLPLLKKNQPSFILNVSSMAGFAPISVKNIYSATKSAMIFFSYSLRHQLEKENISVSCLCPGPVFTKPSIEKETINKLGWFGKYMAVAPEKIGEIAIDRTLKKDEDDCPWIPGKNCFVFYQIPSHAMDRLSVQQAGFLNIFLSHIIFSGTPAFNTFNRWRIPITSNAFSQVIFILRKMFPSFVVKGNDGCPIYVAFIMFILFILLPV